MNEQSQKLFVFIAKNVPISAIIRKGKMQGRPCYQIIKWDMSTNEFTEGQWLLHKQLFVRGCSISPNGQLFGWIYNQYWRKDIVIYDAEHNVFVNREKIA